MTMTDSPAPRIAEAVAETGDTFATFAKETADTIRETASARPTVTLGFADMQALMEAQTRLTASMMQFALLPFRVWMILGSGAGTVRPSTH